MKATAKNLTLLVNELENIRQSLRYAEICRDILNSQLDKNIEAVYEDYIIRMVGEHGIKAMRKHQLIEPCGVIHGKKLYVIM